MKNTAILPLAIAAALASPLLAQSQTRSLDHNGDYINAGPGSNSAQTGVDAPGDICLQTTPGLPSINGIGVMPDGSILVKNGADAFVTNVGDNGTSILGTFPVVSSDFGVAFDSCRNLIVTCNASDDVIRTYDPGVAAPVSEVPFPSTGYVGAAYDSTRDYYWVCDWTTNEVIAYDAATITEQARFPTSGFGATRLAGLAYDCLTDTLNVGSRDTTRHYVLDAGSGALQFDYASLGLGISDPRGCAYSPGRLLWTSSFNVDVLAKLETFTNAACQNGGPQIILNTNGTCRVGQPVGVRIANCEPENRAIVGYSVNRGRNVIKGVQTCLGLPPTKVGIVGLSGGAGATSFTVPGPANRCLYIQAACLPSKRVTNMQSCRMIP